MYRTLTLAFLFLIAITALAVCSFNATNIAATRATNQPKASPTPRRKLTKPVGGSRGFEMYAGRDASARLIAASSTRPISDQAASAYKRGQKQFEAGKYEEAVRSFAEAVKRDPNSPEARVALAQGLTKTGKPAEAIRELQQLLLAFNPSEELKIWSYYLMGNAYADLAQYKEAIEKYQQAIKLKPDLSKPHYNLGLAYAASDQLKAAAAEFNQAAQLKPDYAEAHYNLGVAYLQLGKEKEAREQQRLLVGLNPALAAKLDALIKKSHS
jgi:tetratricopeptide (TPR) repeat protein